MRKLVSLFAGLTLATGITMAQNNSERCELPEWSKNLPNYLPNPTIRNWVVKGVKYHTHIYDINGDTKVDMGVFFELGENGQILNHPEKPKFYAFDFDESNFFTLDELCEKRVKNGKIEWYKVNP